MGSLPLPGSVALEARALSMPAGGVVRYVRGLLAALNARGRVPHVLVDSRVAARSVTSNPVTVVPPPGELFRLWWDARALPRAIRRLQPSLVHLTKPNGLLPRSGLPPTIMTMYDIIPLTAPETQTWAQRAYWTFHLPRAARRADHILTISEWSKRAICERLSVPAERVTVTYPGIDPSFTKASEETIRTMRNRYGIAGPYVLTVGTIEPRKNVDLLLRAFAGIASAVPHALVIAGRWGWKTEAVAAAAGDPRLAGRVRVLGRVSAEDLPALQSGADLFVFLSRDEGFGFPPLEALACGTPVLVSTGGSLPEVVGNVGWVVEPREHQVTEQLAALLKDPAMLRTREATGPQWTARYRWEQTARQTEGVYQKFLSAA